MKKWINIITCVVGLASVMVCHNLHGQQYVRNTDGTVRYTVTERNDGSRIVKDGKGRVVQIIRERNDGTTVIHNADGTVKGTAPDHKCQDSLEIRK